MKQNLFAMIRQLQLGLPTCFVTTGITSKDAGWPECDYKVQCIFISVSQ